MLNTHWKIGGLIPLQRSSRCILQPQPTGQDEVWNWYLKKHKFHMSNHIVFVKVPGNFLRLNDINMAFFTDVDTWMSQRFCNILVTWDTVQQPPGVSAKFVKETNNTLNFDISSSLDTLRAQFTGVSPIAWSMVSESAVLGLPHLTWSSSLLKHE